MKIKYLAAGFTLTMLLAIFFFIWQMNAVIKNGEEKPMVDMVYYNRELKQIGEAIRSGMKREDVEAHFDCSLLFLADSNWREMVNNAITKGYVLLDYEEEGQIAGKVIWDRESRMYGEWKRQTLEKVVFWFFLILIAGDMLLLFLYYAYIRPFRKLEAFSAEIAKGNLDLSLPMQRHNFFGAFTESFDLMREELKKAREREYQANQSKKELVAELSHDIKTPTAAIKAVCEVLEVTETSEDIARKVGIIAAKADTIDKLVNNLFHATLNELEMLKVEPCEESSLLILQMFENMKGYGDIFNGIEVIQENEIPACLLVMDRLRLEQVIDNLISNASKYASIHANKYANKNADKYVKTSVSVCYQDVGEGITVKIKDNGEGVPEEELSLVTEKFYRGSNTKGISGAGLGLYLAKYFMEQMQGGLECYNDHGFAVILFLRKV